jgi:glycosyltransferase involved in cell wall biosynthesis
MTQNQTLLVNYTGRFGGGPIFAYEMTRGLIQNGIKVVAIVSANIENLDEWKQLPLERLVIIPTYTSLPSYILRSTFFRFKQARTIKKQTRDLQISNIYIPMICPWSQRINKLFRGAKVFTTVHDPIPHSGESLRNKFLSGRVERRSDALITLSREFVPYLETKFNLPTIHIPHGRFNYYKDRYFTEFKDNGKTNFLFFGRIEHYKGLTVLANAFKLCQSQMDNFTLTIAGRGDFTPYAPDFDEIQNFTLVNRWISQRDINDLFELKNTILIMPYLDATQSGVVLIAMEYNVPTIASDAGGLKEQITHNQTGILFETGNAEALATQILALYNDKKLRETLGANAYKSLTALNWDIQTQKLIDFIYGNSCND